MEASFVVMVAFPACPRPGFPCWELEKVETQWQGEIRVQVAVLVLLTMVLLFSWVVRTDVAYRMV
eukprot:14696254-Ditylum_brightwellii.AAC.1